MFLPRGFGRYETPNVAVVDGGDPYWSSVVLLLQDGTGTTFTDLSSAAHTVTATGNASWTDTTKPAGATTSIVLDGASDFLQSADSDDWALTGDFTVEWFVNTTQTTQFAALTWQFDATFGAGQWGVEVNSPNSGDGKCKFWQRDFSGETALLAGATSIIDGAWGHLAVTRSGDNWNLWVRGSSDASATQAVTVNNSNQPLTVGRQPGFAARDFNGNITGIRITKGVARYTGAFTPPTLPYPTS